MPKSVGFTEIPRLGNATYIGIEGKLFGPSTLTCSPAGRSLFSDRGERGHV